MTDFDAIWAAQGVMEELFEGNTQAITKHLGNIYEDAELIKEVTCSKMEQVRLEGNRRVTRQVEFYNLVHHSSVQKCKQVYRSLNICVR